MNYPQSVARAPAAPKNRSSGEAENPMVSVFLALYSGMCPPISLHLRRKCFCPHAQCAHSGDGRTEGRGGRFFSSSLPPMEVRKGKGKAWYK